MTWPAPAPGTVARMRAAAGQARTRLQLHPVDERVQTWGWCGRTYGQPVRTSGGLDAWLRIASVRRADADDPRWNPTFWTGAVSAQQTLPPSIPRPVLRCCDEWEAGSWRYRAEVHDRSPEETVGKNASLTHTPRLPPVWWQTLKTAVADVAIIPTTRHTICQPYLDWVMPRFLGDAIESAVPLWVTSHGDLNWANLCGPDLVILDWEGWGLAPAGYDVAILHAYSLLMPDVAAQVRNTFADIFNGPHGRFAELATIAELLHAVSRGDLSDLATPLRRRAAVLLGHDVPQTD